MSDSSSRHGDSKSRKIRVAVLYGGRSGEHEVSLHSAASVVQHLDKNKYEVILVGVDKQGHWHLPAQIDFKQEGLKALPIYQDLPEAILNGSALTVLKSGASPVSPQVVDVVFPVMHGTFCEDGATQGLLELADVPYVGSGVLGSAVCMDKDVGKRLARDAGIPIVPYLALTAGSWARDVKSLTARIEHELGWPVFVKPANLGSSVGVHKVKKPEQLAAAVEDALSFDTKILIEKAISAREIEVSVLESPRLDELPQVSIAGEIIPTHEFYSYEAKYLDENGAALVIPAQLDALQMKTVQELAARAFVALECEGMGRVDFFLDKGTGEFYLNEINTIPGFTSISMYPKMWEASGLPYAELLNRLIELAVLRHDRKAKLVRHFQRK